MTEAGAPVASRSEQAPRVAANTGPRPRGPRERPSGQPAQTQSSAARTEAILKAFHEESALGKAYDTRLLLRLWPFVKPHRRWLTLALGVVVVTALLSLVRPLIMKTVIDDGILKGEAGVLMRGGAFFAAVVVIEQVMSFAQIYALQVVGAHAMADMRRHVFQFLSRLRVGFFDSQPVGRLVTRVTNDIDSILELFASGALNAFGDLVRLLGIVILMVTLDWRLSLIGFAAAPPVALLVILVRRRAREAYRDIRAKTARMNATMNEQVNGMTVIQAFGRQNRAADEFDSINAGYRDSNIKSIKYEAMQDAAIEAISSISLASIVMALGYHQASFGTVVAFAAYLTQFFEPISALAQRYTLLQSAMAGAERVFNLLEVEAPDAPAKPAAPVGDREYALSMQDVSFEYKPGVPVLRNVDLEARRGEKLALVGPTGSGKTTIVSLFLRLYDTKTGVVRVDGEDVAGLAREDLRGRFAVVAQDVFLFPGSLVENIAVGQDPDPERVRQVLERLGALDLFLRRPEGLNARVDEHGQNFSAGERQLIAFARALYRDAQILILDEATASVDSDTEARIQRALEELLRGRTALIIAHRLSTIRAADQIVVLHKGRAVERGTHDELMRNEGLYSALYALQYSREQLGDRAEGAS